MLFFCLLSLKTPHTWFLCFSLTQPATLKDETKLLKTFPADCLSTSNTNINKALTWRVITLGKFSVHFCLHALDTVQCISSNHSTRNPEAHPHDWSDRQRNYSHQEKNIRRTSKTQSKGLRWGKLWWWAYQRKDAEVCNSTYICICKTKLFFSFLNQALWTYLWSQSFPLQWCTARALSRVHLILHLKGLQNQPTNSLHQWHFIG